MNPFIDSLYDQGVIDQKIFSFHLSDYLEESEVTFGGLGSYLEGKEEQISYHNLKSYSHWTIALDSVYFGNEKIEITT